MASHARLAHALPSTLKRFFAKHPPKLEAAVSTPGSASDPAAASATSTGLENINPFKAFRNPTTGLWRPAMYSLRRQADLVKVARKFGCEELLPPGPKSTTARLQRQEDRGMLVHASEKRVKGHKWERTLAARLDKRREAMLNMPQMIQHWKQRGHGRGIKKWPK